MRSDLHVRGSRASALIHPRHARLPSVVGDWTTAFAAALGCNFAPTGKASTPTDAESDDACSKRQRRQTTVAGPADEGKLGGGEGELVQLPVNVNLPRVMVDGCVRLLGGLEPIALWSVQGGGG